MKYEIESDIQKPKFRSGYWGPILEKMNVGDSIMVEWKKRSNLHWASRRLGFVLSYKRITKAKVRVWRMA